MFASVFHILERWVTNFDVSTAPIATLFAIYIGYGYKTILLLVYTNKGSELYPTYLMNITERDIRVNNLRIHIRKYMSFVV